MTRPLKVFALILLSVALTGKLSAQEPRQWVEGRITDSETGEKLMFVHIWNESKKLISISDTSGFFKIYAGLNDTLAISALGYLGKKVITGKDFFDRKVQVTLEPQVYNISEVQVVALGSYSQFKQKFSNLKLPETETEALRNSLITESKIVGEEAKYNLAMKAAAEGGSIASASILTPEEKQYIRLREILNEEKVQQIIDRKYNRQYVADITGLSDKDLDEFMLFCQFEKNYLLNARQDEIFFRIIQKFEDFKRLKKSSSVDAEYFLG